MAHFILVPSTNAVGDFTNAVELPNWVLDGTETIPEGLWTVYQKFQSDLVVDDAITTAMFGLGE